MNVYQAWECGTLICFCIINLYVVGLVSSCGILSLPEGREGDMYSSTSKGKLTWTQVHQR